MRSRKTLWIALAAATGIAAIGASQVSWNNGQTGPIFYDRGYGVEMVVSQLVGECRSLESELYIQRTEIANLKKDLKAQTDKAAKLEKRVRNMELRGK